MSITDTAQTHDHTRSLLAINGADATSFLQGILTQDILNMQPGEARFSAWLSPQGKWLFDFFVIQHEDGFLLDMRMQDLPRIQKGLALYKLRAEVSIAPFENQRLYYLPANADAGQSDPRHKDLPKRLWQSANTAPPAQALSTEHYHEIRIGLCIPEGGIDVTDRETAMDASYDMLHAISFTKGCYIGQEVTARMHYKSIARKGFYAVHLPDNIGIEPLPASILADGKIIAELRSAHGHSGIAFGKFETVLEAQNKGADCMVGSSVITLSQPDWQQEKYAKFNASVA
jgi:folate-binding protein YgfZ